MLGFHKRLQQEAVSCRRAKLSEMNSLKENLSSRWSNQAGKTILTIG